MARHGIREMKQSLHAGTAASAGPEQRLRAREAALSLLGRSVRMRHRRLAVIRLHAAVSTGAVVPEPYWSYCKGAAVATKNAEIEALYNASMLARASSAARANTT